MASHVDVAKRIENGIGRSDRLHVHTVYHGGRLAKWLTEPMDEESIARRAPDMLTDCAKQVGRLLNLKYGKSFLCGTLKTTHR